MYLLYFDFISGFNNEMAESPRQCVKMSLSFSGRYVHDSVILVVDCW